MARNATEMQHRGQRSHKLLHGYEVLVVLYHQDVVRSQVFQGGDRLGEVWGRDLHFVDFIKVRPRSIKWVTVERLSNVAIFYVQVE